MMNQLIKELGILPLVPNQTKSGLSQPINDRAQKQAETTVSNKPDEQLNKEELRLLVKILKAIGHSCEHQHINIRDGVTHYQFNGTSLVFDDVNKSDHDRIMHLSPLSLMLKDPNQKRPTWEKLKALKK